jgi:uncharacterized damage-inducible protein DinB
MKAHLLSVLENSRNYTLAVAESMPENLYHSKPTEGIWNFGELLQHIAYGIKWWEENYIKAIQTEWNPPAVKNNKEQAIEKLELAYASLKDTLGKTTITDSVIKGFYSTTDHITHHRAQAVIYLRCKGIIAPEYVH